MVRCGRTLRRGSIKAYFVGVDDHIDPRLQGTNQGLGYTLTWQNGRQFASMRFGTVNIGFTYDVDGLRTSKTVHNVDLEHKYYYVGNRLQYEMIGDSSALWYFYDADGNPSGIRYKDHNGTVNDYYFVCNWRSDVIQIYNAAGELVSTYDYDAWGRVSENSTDKDTQNIAEINPIRYRGYYYDSETGLYYVNSRYYDPAVKRFLNSDDDLLSATSTHTLANKNYFAYCDNDPITRIDSNGDLWELIVGAAVIGGLTSGAVSAVSQYMTTGNIDWKVVGVNAASGVLSGAVAATSIGLVGSIGVNAILGGATYAIEQKVKNETISLKGLAASTFAGAVGGAIGGKGANVKSLSSSWKFASKGILRESRRANAKYASKQIARYTAQKAAVKSSVKGSIGRMILGAIGNAFSRWKMGF